MGNGRFATGYCYSSYFADDGNADHVAVDDGGGGCADADGGADAAAGAAGDGGVSGWDRMSSSRSSVRQLALSEVLHYCQGLRVVSEVSCGAMS